MFLIQVIGFKGNMHNQSSKSKSIYIIQAKKQNKQGNSRTRDYRSEEIL